MTGHEIVSEDEWVEARKALLTREKAFTRERDALAAARRALPWRMVEKAYVFEGSDGRVTLADLFGSRSQLIVYHFMFGPDWEAGCKACSYLADHFDGSIPHLAQRDVAFAAASRGPLDRIRAFRERMGWRFTWVSCVGSDFNRDFHVSFEPEEQDAAYYNYTIQPFPSTEAPGASVFAKDSDGTVFHTYSVYQRGLDAFIGAYQWLDIVPKGRDESGLPFAMEWVRLKDEYGKD